MRVALAACSLIVASLLAAGCGGHRSAADQTLRTCVDRWNQDNMVSWGPTAAEVGVALLRVRHGERSRCVVALAVSSKRRSATYVCVMTPAGAYGCPTNAEGSPPLGKQNATVELGGHLTLHVSLKGTHPTPPLTWQRYPHVEGVVKPWTAGGKLRAGLRFSGADRGPCFLIAETITSGISCLTSGGGRYEACFPQHRRWRAGDLAACAGLGPLDFVRWTITERR